MTTQAEFYEANAVDGNLSDAQMMQMLNLPEGDSAQAQVSVPDAETPPEPVVPVEVTAVEAKPVILAKDGVHTIEYEKLVEAREEAKHWKQVALDAQAAKPEAQKAPEPAVVETPSAEDEDLFGDFSEEGIKNGVKKLVASERDVIRQEMRAELERELAPLKEQRAMTAAEAHFAAIEAVHPDVDSIAQSAEFKAWIDKQPSFVRDGYQAVIAGGTAEQVIEALNTYKQASGQLAAPTVKTDVAAAAQAAIAKAQSKPPMSLSEIPAGSMVASDEAEAALEKSSAGMMSMFEGKTPEQIANLMNRLL